MANAEEQDIKKPGAFHKEALCSYNLAQLLSVASGDIKKFADEIETDYKNSGITDSRFSGDGSFVDHMKFVSTLLVKLPAEDTKEMRDKKAAALKVLIERIG